MRKERTRGTPWVGLWLPPVLWMGLIFTFSSMRNLPAPTTGMAEFLLRKSAHLTEYAVLGLLLLRAWQGSLGLENRRSWLPSMLAIVLGVLYAASDEFHQSFVPTRQPTVRDVIIDLIGITVAVALAWWWQQRGRRPDRS